MKPEITAVDKTNQNKKLQLFSKPLPKAKWNLSENGNRPSSKMYWILFRPLLQSTQIVNSFLLLLRFNVFVVGICVIVLWFNIVCNKVTSKVIQFVWLHVCIALFILTVDYASSKLQTFMHGGRKFPHVLWQNLCVFANLSVNCLHRFAFTRWDISRFSTGQA